MGFRCVSVSDETGDILYMVDLEETTGTLDLIFPCEDFSVKRVQNFDFNPYLDDLPPALLDLLTVPLKTLH
jgi:hypothetical protein